MLYIINYPTGKGVAAGKDLPSQTAVKKATNPLKQPDWSCAKPDLTTILIPCIDQQKSPLRRWTSDTCWRRATSQLGTRCLYVDVFLCIPGCLHHTFLDVKLTWRTKLYVCCKTSLLCQHWFCLVFVPLLFVFWTSWAVQLWHKLRHD